MDCKSKTETDNQTGLHLAPTRVVGIVFVDPIDDSSKRPADQASEAFLSRLDGPDYAVAIETYWEKILTHAAKSVRREVVADLRATPQSTVLGSMRGMLGFDAEAALASYEGPMISVTTPINELPSSLHRVITRIRQEKMSDASHWLHLDHSNEFNAVLDRFLAQVGA